MYNIHYINGSNQRIYCTRGDNKTIQLIDHIMPWYLTNTSSMMWLEITVQYSGCIQRHCCSLCILCDCSYNKATYRKKENIFLLWSKRQTYFLCCLKFPSLIIVERPLRELSCRFQLLWCQNISLPFTMPPSGIYDHSRVWISCLDPLVLLLLKLKIISLSNHSILSVPD
jgi:hypothetical protein